VVTRPAIENAFRAVCAVGGSTNTLLHLQAIAGRLDLGLGDDRLREISASTPFLADVRPSGRRFLHEFEADGGVPALMHELRDLADLDALAGDDRPWRMSTITPPADARCLHSVADPAGPTGSLC